MKNQTLPKEEDALKSSNGYTVWFSTQDRIASFHAVENYTAQTFISHDTFLNFLRGLQESGYKFQ